MTTLTARGAIAALLASSTLAQPQPQPQPQPTPADAKVFVAQVNDELKRLTVRSATADWIKQTYITDDTERNLAAMNEDLMAYMSRIVPEAARFDGVSADLDTKRMLHLLKISSTLPAPRDPAKRRELADAAAKLGGMYGKGKWCGPATGGKPAPCYDILATEQIFQKSRSDAELRQAWVGWHGISRDMKPIFERLVALGNEGAREIGFD